MQAGGQKELETCCRRECSGDAKQGADTSEENRRGLRARSSRMRGERRGRFRLLHHELDRQQVTAGSSTRSWAPRHAQHLHGIQDRGQEQPLTVAILSQKNRCAQN